LARSSAASSVCARRWPPRLEDVEEIDVIETQLGRSEFVTKESRRAAMEARTRSTKAARHRTVVDETERSEPDAVSDPYSALDALSHRGGDHDGLPTPSR